MRTRRHPANAAGPALAALVCATVLAAATAPAAGQEVGEAPPTAGPPPGSTFDATALQLPVQGLDLPPGFGVAAGPGTAAGRVVAGAGQRPPLAGGDASPSPADGRGPLVFVPADPPPPARLLPGARLDVGSISGFAVNGLNLPAGFGVGVGVAATTSGGTAAGQVAGNPPARWAGQLTFVAADPPPPTRLPPGARFGSGGVSFGESGVSTGQVSNVNFGGSATGLGGAGAGFGGGVTDLGGMNVKEEGGGLRFTLGADVLFDFDKFALRPEADPILRKLVEQVRAEVPNRVRYMVEGHTDAKGTDVYNLGLSNRRARSVRDWFVKQGVVTSRDITTIGLGEGNPVAPNEKPDGSDDPEGRQKNRRVEILVTPMP